MDRLTEEQQAVVQADGAIVAVNAFAGAGKTTTLKAFAEARPNQRILYLAFNRAIAEEAKAKMPSYVTCKTSHALAWAAVARHWPKRKLQDKLTALRVQQLSTARQLDLTACGQALAIYTDFLHSPHLDIEEFLQAWQQQQLHLDGSDTQKIAALVRDIWAATTNPEHDLPAVHDTYFKLWQMGRPRLDYDIILLDEAQDTNPALFDVFIHQQAQRVLVGDRHQNIYSFRGALNAMRAVGQGAQHYRLSQSFRFGVHIAEVANKILSAYAQEETPIKGNPAVEDCVDGALLPIDRFSTALLARTNAGLFAAAYVIAQKGGEIHLPGGFESYAFDDVLDLYHLKVGRRNKIRNRSIAQMPSWESLVAYVRQTNDQEMRVRAKVVEQYADAIPHAYETIRASTREEPASALTLTTAHRSKGCEWDQVILADDYMDLAAAARSGVPIPTGEVNLAYVAVTRARRHLLFKKHFL
ncbi:MAG: UvrD-helicase domain-containing protein [Rhodocyclaceae bacterium]|nr:UvrD-helicase domain-containing protein [Rhodocyclaceae bacterium]